MNARPSTYYDENYRALLPDDQNARILDLGCGPGDFVRFIHQLGYRNVTAIDQDEKAIAGLRELDGVTAIAGRVDAEFLMKHGDTWDLIVAKQMMYYFDRKEAPRLVQAIGHLLSPNGRLVVEIFNGALLSSRFTELKDPAILTAYTEQGLKRLLESNGFVVERLVGSLAGSGFYRIVQAMWFKLYRALLIVERGRDDELPRISQRSLIAVARKA